MEKTADLLTIKEFAEAAGRSQQAIYKQISTRLASYVQEIDGQKYLQRKALVEVFQIGAQPEMNNQIDPGDNPDHPLYRILQEELAAKNRLIEQLQTELADERKHSRELTDRVAVLAEQAQALHAGTIQTQLLPGEKEQPIEVEPEASEPEQKKGFWHWLTGR